MSPWKALPPLKSVRRLPRDLIVHVRFVMVKMTDPSFVRTAAVEERYGDWTF